MHRVCSKHFTVHDGHGLWLFTLNAIDRDTRRWEHIVIVKSAVVVTFEVDKALSELCLIAAIEAF